MAQAAQKPTVKKPEAAVIAQLEVQHPEFAASEPLVVPLAELNEAEYVARHVNLMLTDKQSKTLKSLMLGLDAQGARLLGGKRVQTPPDAIRWLLETLKPDVAKEGGEEDGE